MVGTIRFELTTPSTPRKCATKLRYVPMTYCHYTPLVAFNNFINVVVGDDIKMIKEFLFFFIRHFKSIN